MNSILFPCKECDHNILLPISNSLCECSNCGHPQDIPNDVLQEEYYLSLEDNDSDCIHVD